MKRKRTFKPKSEDVKHFERLLGERIHEEYKDVDPAEWFYIHDGGPFTDQLGYMAQNWDEARALVDILETTYLDEDYQLVKQYPVVHLIDTSTRSRRLTYNDGDPDEIIHSQKTRAEILARLAEIAHLDFGDDPDMWRRWFTAYDEDDFFPPMR